MNGAAPRYTLIKKIITGFVIIILFMAAASLVILNQVKTIFASNQNEFQNIQLIQGMISALDAQDETARTILTTHDTPKMQLFDLFSKQFEESNDSLLKIVIGTPMRTSVESIKVSHDIYNEFVRSQLERLSEDPKFNEQESKTRLVSVSRGVRLHLHTMSDAYIPTLNKALKNFEERREETKSFAYVVVGLSLVVGLVTAVMVARTLTKPIQALKAGAEKVGDGVYETIRVTTTDEVADLTKAFNLMSDKLRHLDEMRMQMMSEISHEMRTPLQVIKAGCYSIMHTKDGPSLNQRQRDAVAMIHQATNRINTFVNSFLDVAKMEAGLMKFNFQSINLVDLLMPLVQEAQLIAQTRQITMNFLTEELPPLMLDKERISQVFSNLLSNALKYTPDGGTITLSTSKAKDCEGISNNGRGCVRIQVADSGVGIPEADLKNLFSKFFQAKNVPFVNEKGSGLGLALVKHVSEAHGGRVVVKSEVGVGSTFIVELPA